MRLGRFLIHKKEQWDLGDIKPIICIHMYYDKGGGCKRLFCLWKDKRRLRFLV